MQRFAGFDGLRAFAALSVLVTHTAGVTTFNATNDVLGPITARLNVGVAVFFVISGFLLFRPYVTGDQRPLPEYARSRAVRIFPAYWLALTLLAVWPGLTGVFTGDWWRYYGLVQNYDRAHLISGLGPAWSLAIELTFYAFLPVFARFASARPWLPTIATLALLSFATRTWMHAAYPDVTYSWWLPGTFLWFAGGMALAVLEADGARVRRAWPWWTAAVATLLALSYLGGLPRGGAYRYTELGWALEHLGFALFAVLLVVPVALGAPPAVLRRQPLPWLGSISYGIYLWQVPLALQINEHLGRRNPPLPYVTITLATAAATIACAAVSYYGVERPALRRLKPSGSSRRTSSRALAAAAVEPRRSST